MTVRNYLVWAVVAFVTAACSLETNGPPSADGAVNATGAPGEPVSLSRSGRGVQPETPPVPMQRRVAALEPPLPAVRPKGIGNEATAEAAPADDDPRAARRAPSGSSSVTYPESDAAVRPEPIDEPLFEPKKFFGMSADGVRTLLGPPQMVYERPPSTVWHYRDGLCELDLYFYLDVASGKFRVATFDLSPHGADADQRQSARCLKRLRIAYNAP